MAECTNQSNRPPATGYIAIHNIKYENLEPCFLSTHPSLHMDPSSTAGLSCQNIERVHILELHRFHINIVRSMKRKINTDDVDCMRVRDDTTGQGGLFTMDEWLPVASLGSFLYLWRKIQDNVKKLLSAEEPRATLADIKKWRWHEDDTYGYTQDMIGTHMSTAGVRRRYPLLLESSRGLDEVPPHALWRKRYGIYAARRADSVRALRQEIRAYEAKHNLANGLTSKHTFEETRGRAEFIPIAFGQRLQELHDEARVQLDCPVPYRDDVLLANLLASQERHAEKRPEHAYYIATQQFHARTSFPFGRLPVKLRCMVYKATIARRDVKLYIGRGSSTWRGLRACTAIHGAEVSFANKDFQFAPSQSAWFRGDREGGGISALLQTVHAIASVFRTLHGELSLVLPHLVTIEVRCLECLDLFVLEGRLPQLMHATMLDLNLIADDLGFYNGRHGDTDWRKFPQVPSKSVLRRLFAPIYDFHNLKQIRLQYEPDERLQEDHHHDGCSTPVPPLSRYNIVFRCFEDLRRICGEKGILVQARIVCMHREFLEADLPQAGLAALAMHPIADLEKRFHPPNRWQLNWMTTNFLYVDHGMGFLYHDMKRRTLEDPYRRGNYLDSEKRDQVYSLRDLYTFEREWEAYLSGR